MTEYLERIVALLRRREEEEAGAIARAADMVADVICRDGLVHVFAVGYPMYPESRDVLARTDAFFKAC